MIFTALLLAAIITERNDVYNYAGCYTPPAYTFIGTSSRPGIDSCWIPYGTYTEGVGGTEYTRVTSNLMGVVASILGGAAERAYAIGGYYSPIVGDRFGDWPTLLRPITTPPQSWDRGEYLETATNTSLRIADQLNLGILYMRTWAESGTYYYPVYPESIEPLLAKADNYYGHYTFNGGLASSFGSRRLDDMTGNVEPPISSEWSSKIPWSVSDAAVWRFVHPVYGRCTNDIHFLPEGGYFGNVRPNPFDTMGDPMALWGRDAYDAYTELNNACTNSLPVTIEDVLSADTGWKYEVPPVETNSYWTVHYRDVIGGEPVYPTVRLSKSGEGVWYGYPPPGGTIEYIQIHYSGNNIYFYASGNIDEKNYGSEEERNAASNIVFMTNYGPFYAVKTSLYDDADDYVHWRNGTTRLDWKRLGIICQLERQMETTYRNFASTDELPYYNIAADHSILYRSDVAVPLPIPDRNGQTETVRGAFSNATWAEDKDQESYYSKTNDLGWCRPTCRVPAPSSVPGATFDPRGGYPVQIDDEKLEEVIADLCAQWTNNLVLASFYGKWLPLEENGLGLRYTANFMEGWVNVVHPSNTLAASTSDGFHYFEWRETPIAQDEWRSEDGFYFNIHDSANGGCVNLSYSNTTNDWSIGYYNEGFNLFNGDIVIPQVTFTAIESEGNPSNWIWQVSGIDGLASNTASSISWGDDNTKRWHWYRNGTDNVAAMIEAAYIGDPTFQYVYFGIFRSGGFGMWYGGGLSSGPFPRVYTTKTLNVSWTTSSYTKEELVDSYSPLSYHAVYVDPLTETNGTFGVMASLAKHSSAAFTFATAERRDETIARFSGPYYRSYDWDRIKTLRMSDLELLLSCAGSHSMADSTDPWDAFSWQNLRQWSGSERLFRFVGGTDAYNRRSAENARYNLLSALSAKCKSKCTELGGMPIVSMETYGKISEKEEAALKNDLKSARVEARFLLTGIDDFYIEAAVHWDENKSGYVVDQINWPVNPPYTIGSYGWNMIVDCDFSSTSNQYRSARADAHQAPVEKTLWKFKNLRDPNL